MLDALAGLDRTIFLAINAGWSSPALDVFFGLITNLGHGLSLTLLGALGLYLGDRKNFPRNLIYLALAVGLSGLLVQIIKSFVARPRPLKDVAFGALAAQAVKTQVLGWIDKLTIPLTDSAQSLHIIGVKLGSRSFPSGHAAGAFGTATALLYAYRRWWLWLTVVPLAALVALSRVYVGVHFPLDILTGALLGIACSWAFLAAIRKYTGMGLTRPKSFAPSVSSPGEPLIMFVAGETSADTYAANLMRALRETTPGARFVGIGGEQALAAGLEAVGRAEDIAIVGFTGVLSGLRKLRRTYLAALRTLKTRRPDILVCLDLPDFNLALANQAKALGIPVLYYISPQIWAWRTGRVRVIADRIDHMVVALPFEREFYEKQGLACSFIGHPILETLPAHEIDRADLRAQFGLAADKKIVVLAPGSRGHEIKHNTAALAGAGRLLAKQRDDVQFVVPLAPAVTPERLAPYFAAAGIAPVYVRGRFFELLFCADAGAITSGTATLEAALARLPHVICYRSNALNVLLARWLIKVDMIGLPNIILGRAAFAELIQRECSPAIVAGHLQTLLGDEGRARALAACDELWRTLDGGEVSKAVAGRVLALAARRKD